MPETTKKKTTAGTGANRANGTKAGGRKPAARKKPVKEPEFIRSEVIIMISIAVAVILFLSNFHLCGVIGDFLRSLQLGLFGSMGYVAPVLLLAGTCFYIANRGNPRASFKLASVVLALISLCTLCQLLFGGRPGAMERLTDIYVAAAESGSGGGLIGGLLAQGLISVIGTVGAYLVVVVVTIISVVCITEKSFLNFVKKGGGRAYHHARENMDIRRENHARRQEEKRLLMEEKKLRGINLNATKLASPEAGFGEEESGFPPQAADLRSEGTGEEANAARDGKGAKQAGKAERSEKAEQGSEAEQTPEAGQTLKEGQTSNGVQAVNPADIFRGSIFPKHGEAEAVSDGYRDEDSVPFEPDDAPSFAAGAVYDDPDTLFIRKDTRTLKEMEVIKDEEVSSGVMDINMEADTFSIPEAPKRVVTASGKVFETDTEALQKKLVKKQAAKEEPESLTVGQEILQKEEIVRKEYIVPPLTLLKKGKHSGTFSDREYKETAIKLQQTLQNFGVGVTVTNISCGPSVTRYELHPEQGVKVSRIVSLADDIKLSLAAADIRIEAPIPGKPAVGIEVPNKENHMVYLRDILEAEVFKSHPSSIAFAVGKDIGGQVVVTDIGKMPHLLIAGSTGSGKSVCINTLIMSLIYKADPEAVKVIMIDPKVVELSVYNGIPHLLLPVVTDPKKASGALNWAVAEMEDRYKKFARYNVRDLKGYNGKAEKLEELEDENKPQKLPQIIIIIDELADLMMVAPGEVEDSICRLAQLARAAGIHLVIATQRPSVNVITGLIKANVPSRIAFAVSSGVDSRTIIDMNGAEKLLGKGDMLFYPSGFPKPVRVQGAFVSDTEVSAVVDFLTEQGMTTGYNPEVEHKIVSAPAGGEAKGGKSDRDEYFVQAGQFIIEKEKASIGMLQRMYKIGFNRAARIMDQLAEAGVVGEEEGTKPRKVLMSMEEFGNEFSDTL